MNKLLREYQVGEAVDTVCMLTGLQVKQTRQQKPFLKLEFGDSSGRLPGVMWDGFDDRMAKLPQGEVLRVQGLLEEYEGKGQLNVRALGIPRPGSYEPEKLLPSTSRDVEQMLAELDRIIAEIGEPHLRLLLELAFSDPDFRGKFSKAPAAKRWHQPWLGGLLEHTLNVHHHALAVAARYPRIEPDLVSAGALLHDIGKIEEYRWQSFFESSTQGRLLGHLVLAVEQLDRWIARIEGFPEELGWQLKHIILSHHGALEFGSPVVPRTLEALVVHFADDLDAKITGVMRVMENEEESGGDWTSYIRLMEREFFKGRVLAGPDLEQTPSAPAPRPRKAPVRTVTPRRTANSRSSRWSSRANPGSWENVRTFTKISCIRPASLITYINIFHRHMRCLRRKAADHAFPVIFGRIAARGEELAVDRTARRPECDHPGQG